MRKKPVSESALFNLRSLLALLLCTFGVLLAMVAFASTSSSGTLSEATPTLSYSGGPFTLSNPTSPTGDTPPACTALTPCDQFALKVSVPSTPSYKVNVAVSWTNAPGGTSDYDVYVYKGGVTGTQTARAASSKNPETLSFTAVSGDYTIIVVPYDVQPTVPFNATVTLTPGAAPVANPTPAPSSDAPSFANYAAPGGLGGDAGEPSIGVNWKTGNVMFQAGLQTLRVSFNDCTSPARTTWVNKPGPNTSTATLDPILFTDHETGRTFVSQLAGKDSLTAFTDNDGDTYTPSEGGAAGTSGVDHQTIGGGPFRPGPPDGVTAYKNAVYYASQDIGDATAALSRDGGLTFTGNGPAASPMYTIAQCGGLHGHLKVGPDGVVYVPNKGCNDVTNGISRQYQAAVVSLDEGLTWSVRKVPSSKPGGSDPSVGIAQSKPAGQNAYTAYFGYVNADGHPRIAVSRDNGVTWTDDQDVGTLYGTVNTVFPAVVAGDDDRAAFAYLGTSAPGPSTGQDSSAFNGEWHLYVATTYDGGKTWLTVDATPTDPVQRSVICTAGTTCKSGTRNLLDFMDATIDKLGRVLVGYADGCIGACVQGGSNSGTALATIARQSNGRTLFAANDPTTAKAPNSPLATATLTNSTTVTLTWAPPVDNGSAVLGYNVYRGTGASGDQLIAQLPVSARSHVDNASGATFYYYVTAINAFGESAKCDKLIPVAAPPIADPCTLPGAKVVDDMAGDQLGAPNNKDLDILSISIAEPYFSDGSNKLIFTMKLSDLSALPPNRQWRIIWTPKTAPSAAEDRYYVGANSNAGGNAAAVTYEFGTVTSNGNVPTTRGAADSGVTSTADGTIQITISNSKIGNPKAGDSLASLSGRNFAGTGTATVTKSSATDATADAAYTLVGNAYCQFPPAPPPVPTPAPPVNIQLLNISGRAFAQQDDKVNIGGFIVTGSGSKKVIVRGIGPSLTTSSGPVPGRMADPTLELFDKDGRIAFNDNWRTSQQQEITDSGVAPKDDRESAIVTTLIPGNYTAVLRGANASDGVGLVEVFDLQPANAVQLANLSVRANVGTGDNVLIDGVIVGNGQQRNVLFRGIGPDLANAGVQGAMQDPTMELRDVNGTLIRANDNWRDAPNAMEIENTQLAPKDDRDAAIMLPLGAGNYTAIIRGKNGSTGVALNEAFKLD